MNPPAPTSAAPAARLDFPTWLPAMLVKELRQGLRTRGFVGTFMGFQTVMIIAFFFAAVQPGQQAFATASAMFWGLFAALLLLVTPLRALAGLGSEIEGRSVDLLVLTRLTASRIVLGKWISLMAQAALLAAALLPYGVVRYYLGSVDLVSELSYMAGLFAGSAMLTAGALWISGWPRALRLLVGIAVIPAFLSLPNGLFYRSYSGYGYSGPRLTLGPTGGGWPDILNLGVLVFDGLLIIGFSLVQAARRLAPPAENHAAPTRVLALFLLGPPQVLLLLGTRSAAWFHLWMSGGLLLIVCGMELSRVVPPMRVHVRPWRSARAPWRVLFDPLLLPGWPSAALFTGCVLALLFGAGLQAGPESGPTFNGALLVWWLILAWVALVFPVLALSFLSRHRQFDVAGYWIVQGVLAIVGIIAANSVPAWNASRYALLGDAVSQILPGASFWTGWNWAQPGGDGRGFSTYSPVIMVAQLAVLGATILLYRRQSRSYWAAVAGHAARLRQPAADPPA